MDKRYESFHQSLQTGFIDKWIRSDKELAPQILVNKKEENKEILTTITRRLSTCDEFWFSIAFVTTSGIATIMNQLKDLQEKGIKGKILVSQYLNFTQPEALRRLLKFDNIELKIATKDEFHAKGYLFKTNDFYNLIIGSSNLTSRALCTNTEWNLSLIATAESAIVSRAKDEFSYEFLKAEEVTPEFISYYQLIYNKALEKRFRSIEGELIDKIVAPNSMQVDAMSCINTLRLSGKNKALLISATGTGKTYLSAFDAHKFNPKRLLFVVHRRTIAEAALKSYQTIFGKGKRMGLYSGNSREIEKDFIFSTVQTISRTEHLQQFKPNHFDYIVIDETHRAGANSYQKILDYFQPKFLLGMTATPERTDGLDVFRLFDHNIAYEIRLHKALEEEMLSPFHYYGVTDISVDGVALDEHSNFTLLTSQERVDRIIEKAKLYGCDNGILRGLVFCSRLQECEKLSSAFNDNGFHTIALTGASTEEERREAILRLESENPNDKLDYIFTVDIFNEGVDIPKVNQVIMLRPTQSAIVFIQQLGRGLRKTDGKEYLTIIDFIGNYQNNYLVPIALYGDTSYNKDKLRKLIASGSNQIPGTSTINFDKITKERIFKSIDTANMQLKKDLVKDYDLLKFKIGHAPKMMDFITYGSRDPYLYVDYAKSFFNFALSQETDLLGKINSREEKLLTLFSLEINNGKRIDESVILKALIENKRISSEKLKSNIKADYGYDLTNETILSCVGNLNFDFIREKKGRKLLPAREIYSLEVVELKDDSLFFHSSFEEHLSNTIFKEFLTDNIDYALNRFGRDFKLKNYFDGFVLYKKYTRKDVFRILNRAQNPVAQNVGGYLVSEDKRNCPIFVNYHKEENISDTTKYEDQFINNNEFEWMSKSNRTLESKDVQTILDIDSGIRLPLFIKKSNDEGLDFYYMGDIRPQLNSVKQMTMKNTSGKDLPVVKIRFDMLTPVANDMYDYLLDNN